MNTKKGILKNAAYDETKNKKQNDEEKEIFMLM